MRRLAWIASFFALLVLAAVAALAWLVGTESGLRWALARAQDAAGGTLAVEGVRGTLAGTVRIERLGLATEGFGLEVHEVSAAADLLAALGGRIVIEPLRAASLKITLAAPQAGASGSAPPSTPVLPFGVRLADVGIDRLELQRGETRHVLHEVRLEHAEIGAGGPAGVSASASFRYPHERFPAAVGLVLDGSLERLQASVKLQVAGVDGEARAVLQPTHPKPLRSLEARAGPIDLARFGAELPQTALSVRLQGVATDAHLLSGEVSLANAAPGPLDAGRLPVQGIQSRFAAEDFSAVVLENLRIALAGGGTLLGQARLAPEQIRATLEARSLDLRALQSTLRRTELRGRLDIAASRESQSIEGTLSQEGISLSASLVRKGASVEVRSLRAVADGGELAGSGTLELAEPFAFAARLRIADFNPARFGDYPEGSLSGSVDAQGRWAAERRIDARWTLADSTLLGRPVASDGSARFATARVSRIDARASFGTSRASARGAFGGAGDELEWSLEVPQLADLLPEVSARVRASGTLTGSWETPRVAASARATKLILPGELQFEAMDAELAGILSSHELGITATRPETTLRARLRGGWSGDAWSGRLQELEIAGPYPLQLLAPAPLEIARGRVELGRLEAALGEGRLLVREVNWTQERLASSGRFDGLPGRWLAFAAGLGERVRSTLLLDGQWSISSSPELNGTVSLRRASGDLTLVEGAAIDLGLRSASLDARFDDGRLSAKANVETRFGTAALQGELAPAPQAGGLGFAAASPLSFEARVDFAGLRSITQPLLAQARLDGRLRAELRGSGTLGAARIHGTLQGDALSLDFPPYGVYLRNGVLRAELEGDRLRLEEFSIQGGEGRLVASGSLPLRPAGGDAQLDWSAERLRLLERPDMRLTVSGAGEARFDGKRLALVGNLRADRGYFEFQQERLPQLGEDVVIAGAPPPAEAGARLPIALDLQLDLGDELSVRGRGLEGKLTGRVQIVTTEAGELRAYGELRTVNATFLAYGQRLQVDPGTLIFDGPIDNPSLQITAWRRNQAVEAGVQLTGTARAPRVHLVSQPPVPEGERLSWLVLGRASGDASQADLGLLQAAAGALLAGGRGTPVDRRIARAVGLDELSLRGSGELQNQAVAFGKRLSDRLYVSYERGLGALATNLVKLDYALGQRWSLRAETGSTTSAWGLFYRFSWD